MVNEECYLFEDHVQVFSTQFTASFSFDIFVHFLKTYIQYFGHKSNPILSPLPLLPEHPALRCLVVSLRPHIPQYSSPSRAIERLEDWPSILLSKGATTSGWKL